MRKTGEATLFVGKVNSNSNAEFKSQWFGTPFSQGTQEEGLIVLMNFDIWLRYETASSG